MGNNYRNINRIEDTPDVDKSSNQEFFVVGGMVNISGKGRETFKSTPAFSKGK